MTESIAVILPVYNKRNSIPVVYEHLTNSLENGLNCVDFNLVFVDDASTDDSVEIIKSLQASDERVQLIPLSNNLGQLNAMQKGLSMVDAEIIVFTSCDIQNPIENIVSLCQAIRNGHDLAVGHRAATTETDPSSYLSRIFYGTLRFFIAGMPAGGFDMGAVNRSFAHKLRKLDFTKVALQAEALLLAENPFYLPITRNSDKLDNSNWQLGTKIIYAMRFAKYVSWWKVAAVLSTLFLIGYLLTFL